jgi:ABC-type multidrug transport system fused ATPase/permease subunit
MSKKKTASPIEDDLNLLKNDSDESLLPTLDFSIPLFLKYMLWILSLFLSITGLALGLVAILAGFFALDFLESSATGPIDSASSSIKLSASSLIAFSSMGDNISNSADDISQSLSLLAKDLRSTSDSLKTLSLLPGFDGISSMSESSSKLDEASLSLSALGSQSAKDVSALSSIAVNLEDLAVSLKKSKRSVQMGFWLAKISLLIAGICIESLLFSTLVLGLLQGPPKDEFIKNIKKEK